MINWTMIKYLYFNKINLNNKIKFYINNDKFYK